jgi:hypothetical protein
VVSFYDIEYGLNILLALWSNFSRDAPRFSEIFFDCSKGSLFQAGDDEFSER